jgi:pimeloyl-ACP methyl ester carboxylesterase
MKWQRIRQILLAALVLAGLAFVGTSWYVAGTLVASANHQVGPPPNGFQIESVTIPSRSGSTLAAWLVPCDGATATVILLHPIRGDRRAMLSRAELLRNAGFASLLVDLQGHGESPGENVTAGFRERLDVVAAVDFAKTRNQNHKIGIVGWSLGGAAALLASPLDVDVMVLESVYPTISEAVHNRLSMRLGPLSHIVAPALLVQLKPRLGVSPSELRPIDHIDFVGCPVLVASGDCDLHTTLLETRRLYEAANEPKRLVIFQGAEHNDLLAYDLDKYQEVVAFLGLHLRITGLDSADAIQSQNQKIANHVKP